jgi:hypothetical protein
MALDAKAGSDLEKISNSLIAIELRLSELVREAQIKNNYTKKIETYLDIMSER